MKVRTITGLMILVVYLGLYALAAYVHPAFYEAAIAVFMLVAVHEVAVAVSTKFSAPKQGYALIAAIGSCIVFGVSKYYFEVNGLVGFWIFCATMMCGAVVACFFDKKEHPDIAPVLSTVFVLAYPVLILSFMLGIGSVKNHAHAIATLLVVTCMTDMMAYFVGVTFRGKKLAPIISPKKTISGSIGGLLGGILGALVIYFVAHFEILMLVPLFEDNTWCLIFVFVIGVVGSVLTQLGDLIASFVKRALDTKDFGKFLKGHGGIMDRLDGMMINAIFIYTLYSLIGYFA